MLNSYMFLKELGYRSEEIPTDDNSKDQFIKANGFLLRKDYYEEIEKNDRDFRGKFCECGAKATAYLPSAQKYVCDINWRACPTYRAKLRECHKSNRVESVTKMFRREVKEGKYKCFYCDSIAQYVVSGDKPCCSDKAVSCPKHHEWLSALHKKRYDENPEFKKMMRDKLAEVQHRPDVIEKKRLAMMKLHNNDCIPCVEFQENYKESVKNKKHSWYKRHYDNLINYKVKPEDIPDNYEERASLVNLMRSNAKKWMNGTVEIKTEVNHD